MVPSWSIFDHLERVRRLQGCGLDTFELELTPLDSSQLDELTDDICNHYLVGIESRDVPRKVCLVLRHGNRRGAAAFDHAVEAPDAEQAVCAGCLSSLGPRMSLPRSGPLDAFASQCHWAPPIVLEGTCPAAPAWKFIHTKKDGRRTLPYETYRIITTVVFKSQNKHTPDGRLAACRLCFDPGIRRPCKSPFRHQRSRQHP